MALKCEVKWWPIIPVLPWEDETRGFGWRRAGVLLQCLIGEVKGVGFLVGSR